MSQGNVISSLFEAVAGSATNELVSQGTRAVGGGGEGAAAPGQGGGAASPLASIGQGAATNLIGQGEQALFAGATGGGGAAGGAGAGAAPAHVVQGSAAPAPVVQGYIVPPAMHAPAVVTQERVVTGTSAPAGGAVPLRLDVGAPHARTALLQREIAGTAAPAGAGAGLAKAAPAPAAGRKEGGAGPQEGPLARRMRSRRRWSRKLGAVTRGPAKYMLLEVPNFNNALAPSEQMTSYLRLGSVPDPSLAGHPDAPLATGEDLASYVTDFLDDARMRDGSPGFISVKDRKAESAVLHTKGGWRDHSDGNRITTTRGDKVEVVRGNYKLVVLGRQDEPPGGAGWDVSGGHIEGLGAQSCIEWVQSFDGTWKTVETSHKGDTDVTQHGNSIIRNHGERMHTIIGSPDETRPAMGAAADDAAAGDLRLPSPNPYIREQTWANHIATSTGSEDKWVPMIESDVWAKEISSRTEADKISDHTHVRHSLASETKVDGSITSSTTAGTVTDTTVATMVTSLNMVGATTNMNIGNTMMVNAGATENINLGAVIDLTVAAMLQLCVSATVSVNVGPRSDLNLTDTVAVTPSRSEVLISSETIAAKESHTCGVFKVTAASILLG